ncbi:MAG: HAD-IA family hydrolase [Lentisphaeria bacterium]|nr:HAD-IA family hydrolase [Lentisphaeria bacterium]
MTETEPINALTLDVGHTLLFPAPSLDAVYREIAQQHGVDLPGDDFGDRFAHAWEKTKQDWQGLVYGRTHADALAFWHKVNRDVLPPHTFPNDLLEAFVGSLYEAFAHAPRWRMNPELPELMEACRSAHVPVALLSNWDVRLRSLLQELDLVTPFDVVVISAEVGLEKPFPEIFRETARRLGAAPARTLHVGDTWADDVEGALNAGLRAAWYAPGQDHSPEPSSNIPVLQSLRDIIPLVSPSGSRPLANA